MQLLYAKGGRFFEDEPVADSTIEDINLDFVAEYCRKIGYAKSPEEYIRQNKNYTIMQRFEIRPLTETYIIIHMMG